MKDHYSIDLDINYFKHKRAQLWIDSYIWGVDLLAEEKLKERLDEAMSKASILNYRNIFKKLIDK